MIPIYICGLGAVSPAGWGLGRFRDVLESDVPVATQNISPANKLRPLRARPVPPPAERPAFLNHPRLRRSSPITHYATSAALEALASCRSRASLDMRLGLVCCFQSGCVQYSCRFFEETLQDPSGASPLVFPETVFAAPTSHIAAAIGKVDAASSLVGDPATYLQGVALAAEWTASKKVDICVIVGAEESHWLLADALWHFQHAAVLTSGAGAIALCADRALSLGVELKCVTDPHTFGAQLPRVDAARQMRQQLPEGTLKDLLVDGVDSSPRTDAAEHSAWAGWLGKRVSPKRIFGEGLMASAAWQCVAACDAIARDEAPSALVSLVGCNQQAIGAHFFAHDAG